MSDNLVLVRPDGTERTLVIAGLGARAYAFFYDFLICGVLLLAWISFLELGVGEPAGLHAWLAWLQGRGVLPENSLMGALLIFGLYHPILEGFWQGKTFGKKIAGIEVVSRKGRAPAWPAVCLRQIGRCIDCLPGFYAIGIIACLTTENNIRVGDRLANTLVVYSDEAQGAGLYRSTHEVALDDEKDQYIHELLNRWDQMALDRRCKLGAELLSELRLPIPQGIIDAHYDRSLRLRLSTLASRSYTKAK